MGECPSTFIPYQGACVRKCPTSQFTYVTENNQPRCQYTGDATKTVLLNPVSAITQAPGSPLPTLAGLRGRDPERYAAFVSESDRVDAAIAAILTTISKSDKIDNAFRELQLAENIRDVAPDAYETARVAYYSLIKGPDWLEDERIRIQKAEVDPEVARYRQAYNDVNERKNVQTQTRDVMQSVKSGVLSLKDDFMYTTKTFKDQMETLKSQINIERRGREKPVEGDYDFFKWIDVFLNLLIIVGLLYVAYILWGVFQRRFADSARLAPE